MTIQRRFARAKTRRSAFWCSAILAIVVPLVAHLDIAVGQPTNRQFAWFAELVSVDQAAGTVTVRAPFLEPVAHYIDSFTPGDGIVVVWTQVNAEADAVIYVESRDVMTTPGGYIVHAEYEGGDVSGHTLTFTVVVGDEVGRALAAAQPGTPIKVHSPMHQPDAMTPIASVALNERPTPRPEAEPEAEAIVANPDGPTAGIAGMWTFESSLQGNIIAFSCTVMQNEAELSGTCEGQIGSTQLTGEVVGNTVKLRIPASLADNEVVFAFTGAADAAGARMEGDFSVMGFGGGFTALRRARR